MERKFLEELGMEKEVINKILDANSADIGNAKRDYAALEEERTLLKEQLEIAREKLEGLESEDVDGYKETIRTLNEELEKKDGEYKSKLSEMEFRSLLTDAVKSAKGKSAKAIIALLDVDHLKMSKNQKKDIETALASLKESDDYLFESNKPLPQITTGSSSNSSARATKMYTSADLNAHRISK